MSATLDNKENLDADNYFLLAARTWDNKVEEDDTVLDLEGTNLKVFVDAISHQYLDGATVEYTKTLMAEQFQIRNPSASSSCGCGSSFAV